jgi:hypothetical protein
MKPVLEMAQHSDIILTPSVDCLSESPHYKKYCTLMNYLGFSQEITIETMEIEDYGVFNFTFNWEGRTEEVAYKPLKDFLATLGIHSHIVGSGSGLPDGLLYDVDIYTLNPKRSLTNEMLRLTGSEPRLIFKLKGRTDLIVLTRENAPVSNMNIKYFIEIKSVKEFKAESSIREAVLQLIGGNVGAHYHSPPVLLTDLNKENFVFNIIQTVHDDFDILAFELKATKFEHFGEALKYVESLTKQMRSVTRDFARMPTPTAYMYSESKDVDYGKNILIDTAEDGDDDSIKY